MGKKISREKDSISCESIQQRLQTSLANGSVNFITELLAIEHMLPYQDKNFIDSTTSFLNEKNLDLFQFTTQAIILGQDVFRVAHIVVQIFPRLIKIDPISLLEFLKVYDEKTKNDLMSGQLFEPIRKRSSINIDWALSLEKSILENLDKRFYTYLLSLYLGLSDSDFNFGYSKIKIAYTSQAKELKAIGLRGIGLLVNLPDEVKRESVNALILNANDNDEAVAVNAAFSLSRLHEEDSALNDKRIELSKNSPPAVRFEILRQIQFKQGQLSSTDIEIIKNLCTYDLNLKGITDSLDSIVYFLVTKGQTDIAREILTTWVSSHSLEEHQQYNFSEQFDSSIFEILRNKDLINMIVTEWFNADDFRYHHVLQEIISYMGVHGVKSLRFNLDILKTFDDIDFLYIVRKVLGFTHDFDLSISLILSILDYNLISKKIARIVSSVLIEHIGENYLAKTLDRLNLEIKNTTSNTEKYNALNVAIIELQKRSEQRSALSDCVELRPNADHQAELNKAFQKSMAVSMREAQKKSVFQSLLTHVAIKSGLSTFSFFNGEYREPTKMGSFSHGVELPKKDVLDEVGASFERSGFRLAKRGES
ncbi:hypothetical protein C0V70_04225 [Bacteriovorax stolpii]|uniref:Uncharacterized protein n=1 Tax=Bacteriovorax stolpii TaxID=960 RepID=A0A2K9NP84_BACTC|nr:hypothetical protein [Bacteriovorax stolpii]AUN97329.1 hypothetical protein C0V70_04225 [Bacteriovorax stolpii]TDP52501.1 hypothetical protein C8D79_2265 [Bacteriovorax stolpii]